MFNFVALADDNPWLEALDTDAVNKQLALTRDKFKGLLTSGEFWRMTPAEKEMVSPEQRKCRWMSLAEAVR